MSSPRRCIILEAQHGKDPVATLLPGWGISLADARLRWQRYNTFVAAPVPSNVEPSKPQTGVKHRHHHRAYAAEASGLLVIAILLLILVLIRYWPYIPWSAR